MKKIIALILILFCLNSFGQINYFFWAHSGGTLYSSAAINSNYVRNNCSAGYQGSTVAVNISAGTYTSYVSQAAADAQAQAAAQDYANANGSCDLIYWNEYSFCSATRNNCGSGYYSPESYSGHIDANTLSTTVSQSYANDLAYYQCLSETQDYANANGSCVAGCSFSVSATGYPRLYVIEETTTMSCSSNYNVSWKYAAYEIPTPPCQGLLIEVYNSSNTLIYSEGVSCSFSTYWLTSSGIIGFTLNEGDYVKIIRSW